MKPLKEASWGCGGVFCVLISVAVLTIYLITGGLPAKGGRIMKGENAAVCAFMLSGFFFLMGVVSLLVSFLLRLKNKTGRNDSSRGRKGGSNYRN